MHERAFERYPLQSTVQVINTLDDDDVLGVLINISKGGFMMLSQGRRPEPGEIYQVRLVDQNDSFDILVGATCLWQDEASARDSYWSGFQIIDISPEDEAKLNEYLGLLARQA